MDRIIPRLQVFEIDDQSWFPPFLRSRVQTVLTGLWTVWLPPLQRTSPAAQTARILLETFGQGIREYTVVDFCSGAGGPTPEIERVLNDRLLGEREDGGETGKGTGTGSLGLSGRNETARRRRNGQSGSEGGGRDGGEDVNEARDRRSSLGVDFVMTDLSPHPTAWSSLSASRQHLHYIPDPVDATRAPSAESLLSLSSSRRKSSHPRQPDNHPETNSPTNTKILRTFHLSFHHFPDALATEILANTLATADAIVITELIERTFSSLLMEALMLVPMAVFTPCWAWVGRSSSYRGSSSGLKATGKSDTAAERRDWGVVFGIDWVLLLFTYVLPIVPFVVVWDGWMSSLRCRTGDEVMELVEAAEKRGDTWNGNGQKWVWRTGRECHTWPIGFTTYFVGTKMDGNDGK